MRDLLTIVRARRPFRVGLDVAYTRRQKFRIIVRYINHRIKEF